MSTTTTTTTDKTARANRAAAIDRYYRKKWFAVVRLVSYLWAVALLFVIIHYRPEYEWFLEPAVHTLYFTIGGCLGANRQLLKPIKSHAKKGENK